MSDICFKCGSKVELLAYLGDWTENIDLYNFVCPKCGNAGITDIEVNSNEDEEENKGYED